MKPLVLRNGLVDAAVLRQVSRPLELDLEALFKRMEEDALRAVLEAVREGDDAGQAIRRVAELLGEE